MRSCFSPTIAIVYSISENTPGCTTRFSLASLARSADAVALLLRQRPCRLGQRGPRLTVKLGLVRGGVRVADRWVELVVELLHLAEYVVRLLLVIDYVAHEVARHLFGRLVLELAVAIEGALLAGDVCVDHAPQVVGKGPGFAPG